MLDDYSPIRNFTENSLNQEAVLFEPRKALQYSPEIGGTRSDGSASFKTENPKYGATISYYIKEGYKSLTQKRIEKENSAGLDENILEKLKEAGYNFKNIKDAEISEIKAKTKMDDKTIKKVLIAIEKYQAKKEDIPFQGWKALDKEKIDDKPEVLIEIKNKEGDVVKQIIKPLKKGLNRINWDLSTFNTTVVKASDNKGRSWRYGGAMYREVDPGIYEVSIFKRQGVSLSFLGGPVSLKVERLRSNVLTNPLANEHDNYYQSLADFTVKLRSSQYEFEKANNIVKTMKANIKFINNNKEQLTKEIYTLINNMNELNRTLGGSETRKELGEKDFLTINDRLSSARGGWYSNTYGPTALHMKSFEMAKELYNKINPKVVDYLDNVDKVSVLFEKAGGPTILK